ncbi:hypothetical protein MTO96_051898 [Rhipicephalus appendiculatus]
MIEVMDEVTEVTLAVPSTARGTQYAAFWLCATISSTVVLKGGAHGPGVRKCPDGGKCVLGTTCVNISPGLESYGCCPYDRGVPCLYKSDTGRSSEKHGCCLRGHRCQQGACIYDEDGVSLSYSPAALLPPLRRSLRSSSCSPTPWIQCPDSTYCHRNSTCCSVHSPSRAPSSAVLQYACCPHEHAQCCDDGEHCCPPGTQSAPFDQREGHRCHSLNDEPGRTVLASKKYPSLKSVPGDTCE